MPKRLMCVTAHPDDECFAFGGALALAANAGAEVSVICLTDGQAATNRGDAASGADLGRMRREEFERSCKVLGASHYELLDYHDGRLEFAEMHSVAKRLVERIRTLCPQVVLTFGLDGSLNVHPDHTMVSSFTSAAFHWAARTKRFPELGLPPYAPQRLYHQSTSFTLPDREPLMPSPWSVVLDIRSVFETKFAAFREHTSQLPVFDKVKPFWDEHGFSEYYVTAAASTPRPMEMVHDLFAGVDDSL